MRKKKIIISGAIAATIALSSVMGGCSLVSSNSAADMSQVIAEVNIAQAAKPDSIVSDYASAIGTSKIIKRELVAYFLNAGYSYVQSGLSYEKVFTMLMDQLVETAVLTQYATMYLLDYDVKAGTHTVAEYEKLETEQAKYEYLLDDEDIKIAKYSFLSSINSAIDSYEKNILKDTASSSGDATRSTPTGVDTEKDDYYPHDKDGNLDYNVYTGYEGYLLTDSGAYQKDALDGTRRATRLRAYNNFISSLASSTYDLVDQKQENLRDVLSLKYIQDEYVSQLEQRIINKYYDLYEEAQEKELLGDGTDYGYIKSKYDSMFDLQSESYVTESAFSSAISSVSDTSFALYAPTSEEIGLDGKYGFVYNILLPFSAVQSVQLSEFQTLFADSDADGGHKPEYYIARNKLLKNITTTDQRAAWFNGSNEYAFNATEKGITDYYKASTLGDGGYLFFENNLVNTYRYETIKKYDGRYPYNGSVYKAEDDYILIPEKLDIDQMLEEFIGYINYASGLSVTNVKNENYYNLSADTLYKDSTAKDKKINYENFIYASGKVQFTEDDAYNRANVLRSEADDKSKQYEVLSAVNELQYAYTTDTGVLSQYLGYSVDAGSTNYIKEFECAAHKAIDGGAGSWVVCAGDYGWHLIYVTYVFDNLSGAQFTPDWSKVKVEGTFENLFYEMIKKNDIADISTTRRTEIVTIFKTDDTVTTYQNRYQDLLDISNE